jgi:hypothetical protein
MNDSAGGSLLKWIGICILVLIGLVILFKVVFPLIGFCLGLIWGLSGIVAFILKLFVFIVFCVAAVLGLIMLVSWLIREFTD